MRTRQPGRHTKVPRRVGTNALDRICDMSETGDDEQQLESGTAVKDLRTSVGDRPVIKRHRVGEPDRDGEILEVRGRDGKRQMPAGRTLTSAALADTRPITRVRQRPS